MARSALAGVAKKSRLLHVLTGSSCPRPAFQRPTIDRRYCRWAPAAVLLGEKQSADDHWRIAKFALGILSGLAVVGLQILREEDVVLCDASELQKKTPEEIHESPNVLTNKKYNLLPDFYRRQVFFNYERRIRLRSRPEKVFGYFASHRDPQGQSFMTPADLMRAVVPTFPPSDSSIVREGYLRGEMPPGELSCAPSEFFMLFDTNGDGLISFAEYMFFVTLLSIPEKNFRAAFKMFDLNGSGFIDRDEFKEVMRSMREKTRQGLAQENALRSQLLMPSSTPVENGGLVEFFFGKDGKKRLRLDAFEQFLRQLHEEIIRLEFAHYDYKQKGAISAYDCGLSMIAAADMDLLNEYLERAQVLAKNSYKDVQITPEEFHRFADFRKKLPKLALAMSSYGAMTKADFQRAASQVCNVPLSNAIVDIVFQIFDTNQDGHLSSEEFLHAMERREHDIANPMETGIIRFFKCWWRCAHNCPTTQHPNWNL